MRSHATRELAGDVQQTPLGKMMRSEKRRFRPWSVRVWTFRLETDVAFRLFSDNRAVRLRVAGTVRLLLR